MIKNYSETTPIVHELFPVSNKQIELSFTGYDISSDGGLLLLREVENQMGLINRISNCITDNRDQDMLIIRSERCLLSEFFK